MLVFQSSRLQRAHEPFSERRGTSCLPRSQDQNGPGAGSFASLAKLQHSPSDFTILQPLGELPFGVKILGTRGVREHYTTDPYAKIL